MCIYVTFSGLLIKKDQIPTIEAKELTKGVFRHQKDGKIDSIAAKIILERYLEKI